LLAANAWSAFFCKCEKRDRSGAFDGDRHFTLMMQTIARNPAGNNATAFCEKISQQPHILEIDGDLFMAEPAHAPALE
jgi:hypothetical protein